MTELNDDFFRGLVDFDASTEHVLAKLKSISSPRSLLRFFVHYASWNGQFANGVSALSSLIGNEWGLFREPGLPRAVADRSNFVASYFFDAARDEYDDHINPERDSHRCLAQATLLGLSEILGLGSEPLDEDEPPVVVEIMHSVVHGYTGGAVQSNDPLVRVFAGIGYHLGSEMLADREFSMIDEYMRADHSEVVQKLMRTTVTLAGSTHRCYAWIGVHSGHGGGVEADHFDYALEGARQGLKYIPGDRLPDAIEAMKAGFLAFEQDHRRFFCLD